MREALKDKEFDEEREQKRKIIADTWGLFLSWQFYNMRDQHESCFVKSILLEKEKQTRNLLALWKKLTIGKMKTYTHIYVYMCVHTETIHIKKKKYGDAEHWI